MKQIKKELSRKETENFTTSDLVVSVCRIFNFKTAWRTAFSVLGLMLLILLNTSATNAQQFCSSAPISIPESGAANPYPSNVTVSGLTGVTGDVTVTLNSIQHSYSEDVSILLVSPTGQKFIILSNVGGSSGFATAATITLSDMAAMSLPTSSTAIASGTYKPTNAGTGDTFPSPAPAAPYENPAPAGSGTFVSVFGGTNPNGVWNLYVVDDASGDSGSISGGWCLDIATTTNFNQIQFTSSDFSSSEAAGTATITVSRTGGFGAVSVDYATLDDDATGGASCSSGVDYINTSGTLSFGDGETGSKNFSVQLCRDTDTDLNETVNLQLSNPTGGATLGTRDAATLTIRDSGINTEDIIGPNGSGVFGFRVAALPNGNIVVTDPNYSIPNGATNVGAAYLYNGSTRVLISVLTGSTENDQIGINEIIVLANGNYLINSPGWHNGAEEDAGAITFGDAATGVSGVVSASNSLVGSTADDNVGNELVTSGSPVRIIALSNGNYVVGSPRWNSGAIADAGAVTFGNGLTGVFGEISASNSIIGSSTEDFVGRYGFVELATGNYVFRSFDWDNGGTTDAGAVTFGNGNIGVSGVLSSSNSLVGTKTNDFVGGFGITSLTNGNYVVNSSFWGNGTAAFVGAVTFGNGDTGITGAVSTSNSLVGSTANDQVGRFGGVIRLSNGNYVVGSRTWDNGSVVDAGAVTFGNGNTGITGTVSTSNSLYGTSTNDFVGIITALTNGNYVVNSFTWDSPTTDVGAVTFANGETGITGAVSATNSLIGTAMGDQVGGGVIALTNGNYVVNSFAWDGTAVDVGAVTFGNGTTGTNGTVSASNSLVGSMTNDQVGSCGIRALTNGNYVVCSSLWDGGAANVGAVTLGNGSNGIVGAVSISNSLVGSTANDQVGNNGITALTNGNYVVGSPNWDGAATDVGAVTFGNGLSGIAGAVSVSNSLVGSKAFDQIGFTFGGGITALTNGNYVVTSPSWDFPLNNGGALLNVGAATFGNSASGTSGPVSDANSLVGAKNQDFVASSVTALANGNYVVRIPRFDPSSALGDAGAVSYGNGNAGVIGQITTTNSVLGATFLGGDFLTFSFDQTNNQLAVGRPRDNIVTLFRPIGPTAANVSISGRVLANNRGVPGALVVMNDANGTRRTARTNPFGYYRFEDVEAGGTYVFNVFSKQYTFDSQAVTVSDDLTGLDFIAQLPKGRKSF